MSIHTTFKVFQLLIIVYCIVKVNCIDEKPKDGEKANPAAGQPENKDKQDEKDVKNNNPQTAASTAPSPQEKAEEQPKDKDKQKVSPKQENTSQKSDSAPATGNGKQDQEPTNSDNEHKHKKHKKEGSHSPHDHQEHSERHHKHNKHEHPAHNHKHNHGGKQHKAWMQNLHKHKKASTEEQAENPSDLFSPFTSGDIPDFGEPEPMMDEEEYSVRSSPPRYFPPPRDVPQGGETEMEDYDAETAFPPRLFPPPRDIPQGRAYGANPQSLAGNFNPPQFYPPQQQANAAVNFFARPRPNFLPYVPGTRPQYETASQYQGYQAPVYDSRRSPYGAIQGWEYLNALQSLRSGADY